MFQARGQSLDPALNERSLNDMTAIPANRNGPLTNHDGRTQRNKRVTFVVVVKTAPQCPVDECLSRTNERRTNAFF